MVLRCALLILVCLPVLAQTVVPAAAPFDIAEPAFVPGFGITAMTADESRFYVFANVHMTRVERAGAIVDADPIRLEKMYAVTAAAAGSGIVAVVSRTSAAEPSLAGVAPDGRVLWRLADDAHPERVYFEVVFDGGAFIGLWREKNSADTGFTRVDAAGTLLDSGTLARGAGFVKMAAARTRRGVLVAWAEPGTIKAALVRGNGAVTGPRVVAASEVPHTYVELSLAAEGDEALLLWCSGVGGTIRGAIVDESPRVVLGPVAVAQSVSGRHAVAWDGVMYRLAWETAEKGRVETADVDLGLTISRRATLFHTPIAADRLRVVPGAGSVVIVHHDRGVFAEPGAAIPSGAAARPLRTRRADDRVAALVWTGSRYLVVWDREGDELLRARFFTRDGTAAGPSFVVLERQASDLHVAVAADTLLFTWTADGRIGQRFDLEGLPIDAAPFPIPGSAVASDGRDFLIAGASGCDISVYALGARGPLPAVPLAVHRFCELGNASRVQGIAGLHLAWGGFEYGLLFHIVLRSMCYCTGVPDYVPVLAPIERDGSAARAIELRPPPSAGGAGLVVGGGRYFIPWQHEDSGVLVLVGGIRRQRVTGGPRVVPQAVFSTGLAFGVIHSYGYVLRDLDGRFLADVELPQPIAGAGDGRGGAMIIHRDFDRDGVLVATMHQPDPGRRRTVRN